MLDVEVCGAGARNQLELQPVSIVQENWIRGSQETSPRIRLPVDRAMELMKNAHKMAPSCSVI